MTFTCFLDDSKDRSQEVAVVSAGFVGTKDDWEQLRSSWKATLKKHGLEYFKSSEYYGLSGQFAKFRSAEYPCPKGREAAQQMRSELQAVLGNHPRIRGLGVLIVINDFHRVMSRPEARGIIPPNPYHIAFNSVLDRTVKNVVSWSKHGVVAFVHDSGPDYASLRSSYEEFKKRNPNRARRIAGFSPMDDKEHPELQAADMMANYAMQRSVEAIEKGDGNLRATVEEMKANIHELNYWDEDYLLSYLKHILTEYKKPIPEYLQDTKYD